MPAISVDLLESMLRQLEPHLAERTLGRAAITVTTPTTRLFVKYYRAVVASRSFWRKRQTKVLTLHHEAMWLNRLGRLPFRTPELLFQGWRMRGGINEQLMVLSFVPGRPLASFRSQSAFVSLAGAVAQVIAQLHAAGLSHGDCNLYNFLIDESRNVGAIDFEGAGAVTPDSAREDMYKFLMRLKGAGCSADELNFILGRYVDGLDVAPFFPTKDLLASVLAKPLRNKPTRWREPQSLALDL